MNYIIFYVYYIKDNMLTDVEIEDLATKMSIPLAFCGFKDDLLTTKLVFNQGYIINLEDSIDENGNRNTGSHWTSLIVRKYSNGTIEPIFFDPFGVEPSECIKSFVKKYTGKYLPYTKKDIQSLLNFSCGWYSLSFLYYMLSPTFLYRSPHSTLYENVGDYLDMFDDLNTSCDFKKNEYILRMFFRSKDPKLRKEIDVISNPNRIINQDDKGGIDAMKIPYMGC
jgi:hypothetical protein